MLVEKDKLSIALIRRSETVLAITTIEKKGRVKTIHTFAHVLATKHALAMHDVVTRSDVATIERLRGIFPVRQNRGVKTVDGLAGENEVTVFVAD